MHSADCRSLRHLEATYPASHNCHAASPRPTRGCATHTSQARLSGTSQITIFTPVHVPSATRQPGEARDGSRRIHTPDFLEVVLRTSAQRERHETALHRTHMAGSHALDYCIVLYCIYCPCRVLRCMYIAVYTSQCTLHAANLESRNRDEMLLIPDADRLGSPDTRVVAETRWWNGAAGTDSALVGTRIVARVLLTRACRLLLT